MSEERKLAVLRAIVEDYVETREPVGSRALVERHSLGVSPATIRNDMAALEDEGYIAQPHTSAGRVPTDKGYRMFVDRLSGVKPLSQAEKRAIQTLLTRRRPGRRGDPHHPPAGPADPPGRGVQYPSLSRSTVRHVELVALEGNRLLVILITNTGRVEQRMVPQAGEVSEATLSSLRSRLNQAVAGRRLTEVSDLVAALPEMFAPDETALVRAVIEALEDSLDIEREERIVLAGTANLARSGTDFVQTIGPVLEPSRSTSCCSSCSPRWPTAPVAWAC